MLHTWFGSDTLPSNVMGQVAFQYQYVYTYAMYRTQRTTSYHSSAQNHITEERGNHSFFVIEALPKGIPFIFTSWYLSSVIIHTARYLSVGCFASHSFRGGRSLRQIFLVLLVAIYADWRRWVFIFSRAHSSGIESNQWMNQSILVTC